MSKKTELRVRLALAAAADNDLIVRRVSEAVGTGTELHVALMAGVLSYSEEVRVLRAKLTAMIDAHGTDVLTGKAPAPEGQLLEANTKTAEPEVLSCAECGDPPYLNLTPSGGVKVINKCALTCPAPYLSFTADTLEAAVKRWNFAQTHPGVDPAASWAEL